MTDTTMVVTPNTSDHVAETTGRSLESTSPEPIVYDPLAKPLTTADTDFHSFQNTSYDDSLEYDEVEEQKKLSALVSRLIVTSDWHTYTKYLGAMDVKLKMFVAEALQAVLDQPSLMNLSQGDEATRRIAIWLKQDLALNGTFASYGLNTWWDRYRYVDDSQAFDGTNLYDYKEVYESTDAVPGVWMGLSGKNTNSARQLWWSVTATPGLDTYRYSDRTDSVYADGTQETDGPYSADDNTLSYAGKMKVGVRDIAGKYNIYANVSGKYRPHPAPERTQSSVSGSTGGEFKTDVLKNNNTKNDLTLGMDVSGDDTQSAPPDAETKMTGRNRSETVSPYAKLKINKRVGLGGNATGTSTASTDAYSEYTGKSADLYLYGQYAPPDKDTESKNKSDQQRLIGNVKIGAGATWMVDSEHDYDVVQTVDGSKKTLYAKPSLGTNEKHDLSFYLGGKPRFNIVTGTQNGEYFSVSSWAGLEWTPGFNSLSLDVSHYFSQFNDLRYKHTDPETDYYWPEGVYNTEYQEVEIDVAGTLVPTSRLNLDFSGSAVQGWGSGDLSPTDDTSLTATFSAEWLVIKDPNIVFGVEGSWNRGTSVGKMPPTTNTRSDDTYVGISLGSSYNRVGRRN